jgi:DNA recombination protein RmuC
MGFRTLALEQRSAEVWEVLGAVKTEFDKFGLVLAKTKKKLEEATRTIDQAQTRSRALTRHLRAVEALPEGRAMALLPAEPEAGAETGFEGDDLSATGPAALLEADPDADLDAEPDAGRHH